MENVSEASMLDYYETAELIQDTELSTCPGQKCIAPSCLRQCAHVCRDEIVKQPAMLALMQSKPELVQKLMLTMSGNAKKRNADAMS